MQLQGGLTQIYQMWAQRLNKVLAMVEAKIDFEEQAATDIRIAKHEADVSDQRETNNDTADADGRTRQNHGRDSSENRRQQG